MASLWPPHRSVGGALKLQGSLYPDKNRVKISAQSELRISGFLRNGETLENGNTKQKRTEREIQSRRGSRPSTAMDSMDQMGNSPPSRGEAKEEEEGGWLSPPLSRWRRSAAGARIIDDNLHQQSCYHQHQLSPPLCSGVTSLLPVVIST